MNRFFLLSAAAFLLALAALIAFHIGARSVSAQAPGIIQSFAIDNDQTYVITTDGNVWARPLRLVEEVPADGCGAGLPFQIVKYCPGSSAYFVGNIWDGGPVHLDERSLGKLKGDYR